MGVVAAVAVVAASSETEPFVRYFEIDEKILVAAAAVLTLGTASNS